MRLVRLLTLLLGLALLVSASSESTGSRYTHRNLGRRRGIVNESIYTAERNGAGNVNCPEGDSFCDARITKMIILCVCLALCCIPYLLRNKIKETCCGGEPAAPAEPVEPTEPVEPAEPVDSIELTAKDRN